MNYIKINRRFGILTISSVFLLLLAGGVVRSSGSGMGCPDWPKCYGAYFPPTCSCQLPADYQAIYAEKRIKKAERFASLLSSLGLKKQADAILTDPSLRMYEVFNPQKAWTEYINRIIGVLSGLFSLVFFLSLIRIRKYLSKSRFWFGFAGFVMMLFNAWLGSIVVATNLFPIIVTIHYLAAYAVLALFMLSIVNARLNEENFALARYKWFFVFFVLMSVIQVIYGTQLRQVAEKGVSTGELYKGGEVNFDYLGSIFNTHWFLAIGLIFLSLIPLVFLRRQIGRKWFIIVALLPVTLVIQYFSGVINLKSAFPMVPQVSHIFFAGLVFGITLYICIAIFRSRRPV
jgi:cytochrome c oxidase assembly protein subunit 15